MKCAIQKLSVLLLFVFGAGTIHAAVPPAGHVFVVVEENRSYNLVIGNPTMPFLNSLAGNYSLLTEYFANTHPSIGNYFMMTTGQIVTNDDSFTGTADVDNLVRKLLAAGKTWKSYAESLPQTGYVGGNQFPYLKRHNPFSYFTDVTNSPVQRQNLVPFSQFAGDLASGNLPDFCFLVPNALHDAHDGTLLQADLWLHNNLEPLLNSPAFQNDGLLIIVFDESLTTDTANGGGHVAAVVVGPKVKKDYTSPILYQHQSLLRTILESLGVNNFPGASATASPFSDVF